MKTKEEIIQQVLGEMDGDPIHDVEVIASILEENKDHPDIEAIGFELLAKVTDRIPDAAKNEMARILEENHNASEEKLSEVEYLMEDHRPEEALKEIEDVFSHFEMLEMFDEENIFHFYNFEDGLEESIYRVMQNMKTPSGNAPENYARAYRLYGKVLLHLNRLQDAKEKFECSLRWNPMHIETYLLIAEVEKRRNDVDEAKQVACSAFSYAYKKEDIGNIYLFLSNLYLSEYEFDIAYNTAFYAGLFMDTKKANAQIHRVKEVCPYTIPMADPQDLQDCFEKYSVEKAPNEDILRTIFSIANYCEEKKRIRECLFVWNHIYDLLEDQESLTKIDALEDQVLDDFKESIEEYVKKPCEHKFQLLLQSLQGMMVYVPLKKETMDEYATAIRDGNTYFALFTHRDIDSQLEKAYEPIKIKFEQIAQWCYTLREEVNGVVFDPDEEGFVLELDDFSQLIENEKMN